MNKLHFKYVAMRDEAELWRYRAKDAQQRLAELENTIAKEANNHDR